MKNTPESPNLVGRLITCGIEPHTQASACPGRRSKRGVSPVGSWRLIVLIIATTLLTVGTTHSDDIEDLWDSAVVIRPLQPPRMLIDQIERRVPVDDPNALRPEDFTAEELPVRSIDARILDDLPYFHYYAMHDDEYYVVHPMRLGIFLRRNADGTRAPALVEAAVSIAHELPNGGLAWYYPRHYRVSRMLGHDLKYSNISQGALFAGLAAVALSHEEVDDGYARAAFQALSWPFEKGGVNLADRALLEMPSFAGPPEIILNGWIDTLLHLRDYAEAFEDEEALRAFTNHVAFLAEVLPNFDDRQAGISRYSDVSPYRVTVTLDRPRDMDSLAALYVPRMDELPLVRVPIRTTPDPSNFSPYDNQIVRQQGRSADVWISCSQLYNTILVARSEKMTVRMNRGTIERFQSTPGHGGEQLLLESEPHGAFRHVRFPPPRDLICGYPTNFSKDGRQNFYHVYHVVALLLLATDEHVNEAEQARLIEWAMTWHDDMQRLAQREQLEFAGTQDVLNQIMDSRIVESDMTFEDLMQQAKQILSELRATDY